MKRMAVLAVFVCWCLITAVPGIALQINPLDKGMVSVQLTTRGNTPDEALLQAKREAVLASAGRVLLNDKLIRADDLLTKYLEKYAPSFVMGVEVLDDDFTGGKTVINSRVYVNYDALVEDLQEKKFLYTPEYKPMFTVFMEERLEGARMPQQVARVLLSNALQVEGLKPYTGVIAEPAVTIDVSDDELLMRAATIAAERRGIEFIITGECNTSLREERKLYYDRFYFYDCEMTVKAVRVDTGEVFFETSANNAASARDQADAVRLAIERTSQMIARQVDTTYREFWPKVVQAKVDYEVLLTATDEELTRIVSEQFKRLGPDTEINLRKKFDRSAVLTIKTSAGRDEVMGVIESSPYPALNVVREVGKNKFEVQVAG